ncbi:type I glyceraldehyde-3-phosphate dehydrogenase [Roseobacter weihaiensis]|uniref:type I glyceraldehyde-3-phosphate dehydrogenase n=1 Tax=Roseobacter weihaiensis TaxID=2763262 RepID=UPI001D0B6EA8|nr:type I glyceraldehyde-3-phosphate dehydrogenase [Roseobacter sp. H9]
MAHTVGVNGFGRIGRGVLRAIVENKVSDVEVVAINDLSSPETLAHLLKYDSVHGRFPGEVKVEGDALVVNGQSIQVTALRDPAELPWDGVDVAMECTGFFTPREKAAAHLENGSKRVLISAPGAGADRTVVFGVNDAELTKDDIIISNASCTTNCLAPVAAVLDDLVGIKTGYMTTIHAYTGDQPSHDSAHRDPYRGRAAAVSIVPTSTGAAKAIALVLPRLEGRLEGSAVRVPTPNVSLVDLCILPEKETSAADINAAMKAASEGPMKGVLACETDPMVSIDFNHDPHSSCFAAAQTKVTQDGMIRVVSWYDNEWGFANRMIDTGRKLAVLSKS